MLTMLFRNKGVLVRRAVFLTAFIGAAVLTCWSQQSPPSKPNVCLTYSQIALEARASSELMHLTKSRPIKPCIREKYERRC